MQGLSDALADVGEGMDETPAEEYTIMLKVMMADHPGQPHPLDDGDGHAHTEE